MLRQISRPELCQQVKQWTRSLAERRFQIYDTIREGLNRIYCYVEDKGTWKQEDPDKILTYKRMIDQAMFTQRAFWAWDFCILEVIGAKTRELGSAQISASRSQAFLALTFRPK